MWPNRIKERTTVKAADLLDHTGNWRTHPEAQKAGMIGVLDEVGIVDALTVYHSEARGGLVIIDGHLRKSIDPAQEWPVDVLDVTDAEADYILATKDPLAAAAVADREKLGALLQSVQSDEEGVQALLSELAEREGVVFASGNGDWSDAMGGLPTQDRSPFQQMTFTLHDSQVETVKAALSASKNVGDFDEPNENSNGNALARICGVYVNGQS